MKRLMLSIILITIILFIGFIAGYQVRTEIDKHQIKLIVRQNQLINDMSDVVLQQYVEVAKLTSMDEFYKDNLSILNKIMEE